MNKAAIQQKEKPPQRTPILFAWLGAMLRPWLTIKIEPQAPAEMLSDSKLVCYVLERYGVSDSLILEEACRAANLPPPLMPMPGNHLKKARALLAVSRREGWFLRRPKTRTHSEGLAQLLSAVAADPELDIELVPVSIFVGRAPSRTTGWFRVLFSENWIMVGRFRRLLSLLLNGRDTIVHMSEPVSLRRVVDEGLEPTRTVRKASRVLRVHFRRVRTAVIGPDLSHRRMVIDAVLDADNVRDAIASAAVKERISKEQARRKARKLGLEIAADYSHSVVRSASFLLTPFWNKIYGGIDIHHFDKLKAVAPGHEVIYVPCHRSHIDYLLLSYTLYTNGLVPPHIAAGINLNLPVIGTLLRRGGAFFLRRSFRGNALYSAIFTEYVSQLFARGVAMEYFIEGGRSRTGRLLQPRAGMLSMTLKSFMRESRRPVVFQPVYIGYEKLIEGDSYIGELSGAKKEKESLKGLLGVFSILRKHYGKVSLSFGQPIFLAQMLDEEVPNWRDTPSSEEKPVWMPNMVSQLARQVMVNINQAAVVNPVNLLAVTLLSSPKHAMAENDLLAQLALCKDLLEQVPHSERVSVTPMNPTQIIAYGESMDWITRVKHPLGDVLTCEGKQAVLLSYFRNNVLHLFATASWIACCFLNNRRLTKTTVVRLGKLVYPFVRDELFLSWTPDEFADRIHATISFFRSQGLLRSDLEGKTLSRKPGHSDEAFLLRSIAQSLMQAFQRFYIALSLLVKNGSGELSTVELENMCQLTAQRLSLLHELVAPEFFDKSLFRGFITTLKARRILWVSEAGKLEFGDPLVNMSKDARVVLSRELRHSILNIAQGTGRSEFAPASKTVDTALDEGDTSN